MGRLQSLELIRSIAELNEAEGQQIRLGKLRKCASATYSKRVT
jgi:hypothetical protein